MRGYRILAFSGNSQLLELIKGKLDLPGYLLVSALSPGEALSLMQSESFDAVIISCEGDTSRALELLIEAGRSRVKPPCIMIDIAAERGTILNALNAGCVYFIDKQSDVERIDAIVKDLLDGGERQGGNREHPSSYHGAGRIASAQLSRREREILFHMLSGESNRIISNELDISEKTVKNHLWKIYRKFGVENRTQLFHELLSSCPCMALLPVET